MKKYDIILHPSLKKTWVHFDVEFFNNETNESIGYEYSNHHYVDNADYPAFRPFYEREAGDIINNNDVDLKLLRRRLYNPSFTEKVEKLWENINSVKIKNPIYYCLASKLVWQNKKESEKTSDKLIKIKFLSIYDHEEDDIVVVECQRDRLENYMEMGEVYEIEKKHIAQYNEIWKQLMSEKLTNRQFNDKCVSILIRLMPNIKNLKI